MSAKTIARNVLARSLSATGLTAPSFRGRARLTIVTFHRVLLRAERKTYPFPNLAVTPEELDAYLAYFRRHYDCGTLATQHRRFQNRERAERPLLAITFDDGQYDNYLNARPVLSRHGLKASFFVPVLAIERGELLWHDRLGFAALNLRDANTGSGERLTRILREFGIPHDSSADPAHDAVRFAKSIPADARMRLVEAFEAACGSGRTPAFARLMTFGEVADLAAEGHEIGSHSMSHCMMTECDDATLEFEVRVSRSQLEARLGLPIESFCYPNGNSDARAAEAVRDAGYLRAVTTTHGLNPYGADPFRLRRFDMDAARVRDSQGQLMPALLAFRMSGAYPGLG